MRLALAAAILLAAGPAVAQPAARAAFTVVESGARFTTLQEAVDAIGEGRGTIRIAPGTYRDCAVQEAGQVDFTAETPGQAIFDAAICEDKATLVLRGRSARVDGIVFRNLSVPDGNGAGIRLEQGDLEVTESYFADSQGGILSGEDMSGSITISNSTFSGLGNQPNGNGAHAVYIGRYGSLRVIRSRFERGTGGHYLKSRAARVEIVDNSFDDSQGHDTNYHIDLPNGAVGRIAGNIFAQGADKENYSAIITVAPEGREHPSAGLLVEGNRVWATPGARPTTFVASWTDERVAIRANQLGEGFREFEQR